MAASGNKQVLVVGATGMVGRFISEEVIRSFGAASLVVGDYRPERGREFAGSLGSEVTSRGLDVCRRESVRQAVHGVDSVIVAVQQAEPVVQSVCMDLGIHCLDITIDPDFIDQARALDADAAALGSTSIILAGLIPGLSGVMARKVVEPFSKVSSIDVGFLQSVQTTAGPTGIADMLGALAQPVRFRSKGANRAGAGFTVKREILFPQPYGSKTQRLIDYIEAPVVAEQCNVRDVNYWTGFGHAAFDLFLSFLNRVGFLRLFKVKGARIPLAKAIALAKGGKKPKSEIIAITVEASGEKDGSSCTRRLSVVGPSDYGTTAMSVVAMAKLLLEGRVKAAGVRVPMEVFPLDALMDAMDCPEVSLHWLA